MLLFEDCSMARIRIPAKHWGQVWRVLVASGPISRVSAEPVYVVTDDQLRLLRQKKLPFELLTPNGQFTEESNG
jgi:hypothetical protein